MKSPNATKNNFTESATMGMSDLMYLAERDLDNFGAPTLITETLV